ncbi:MAG TPA: TIGR03936 family radical SAM-associated protein [Candidatus Limnocylindrales bacterium]
MVEAVQRWRIAFRRGAPALDLGPAEIARSWEGALLAAGLPLVLSAAATPRPRLSFAAPLPPGRLAEHDLADVVIGERWTAARLRALLVASLPAGFELVDLFDVWLGAPALTSVLNAMSHRALVCGADPLEVVAAAETLLAADRLDRTRSKGAERSVQYDLRPLILGLAAIPGVVGPEQTIVRMILRTSSDGPSGRPDEVILALGEVLGASLEVAELVRERLWTADETPTLVL